MPEEILIQSSHVVTRDPRLGDFLEGDALVRDGVIAQVGPHRSVSAPDAEVVDAGVVS